MHDAAECQWSNSDRRESPRVKVLLAACVEQRGKSVQVRLGDVSERGSAVVGDLPEKHCTVTLRRDGVAVRARVAWAKGGRGGLDFREPVELSRMLPSGPTRATRFPPRVQRPPLAPRAARADERQKLERWAELLGVVLPGRR